MWLQIGKGVHQGCILSPCLFNLYAGYIMWNARLDEAQAGIKMAGRNINHLRYADDTTSALFALLRKACLLAAGYSFSPSNFLGFSCSADQLVVNSVNHCLNETEFNLPSPFWKIFTTYQILGRWAFFQWVEEYCFIIFQFALLLMRNWRLSLCLFNCA